MESLQNTWNGLSVPKRLGLVGALAATILTVVAIANLASRPSMALLYAGLEPTVAGDVVAALEASNTAYEARGQSIYVASNDRDRVRMELAREGLPRQGQAGYELLEGLSSFGTTTQMFDAAYWRAKEGELARTILATPGVRSARVHIASPSRGGLGGASGPVKASVTLATVGGGLAPNQALAIRYVVALAIDGLDPENVAVIDSQGGVLLAPGDKNPATAMTGDVEDRRERLRRDLMEMLEARVGPGAVRVNVAMDVDMERETVSEMLVDPDSRITISQDSTSVEESSSGRAGAVSVATNLPGGDARGGDGAASQRSETRETTNYDYSQTERMREKMPGRVERLSVAVLVDEIVEYGEDGATTSRPRTDEELEQLRALVAGAVGFNAARGDVITVESMAFARSPNAGVEVTANPVAQLLSANAATLIQLGVLSVVAIALSFFVVRPILVGGRSTSADDLAALGAEDEPVPALNEAAPSAAAFMNLPEDEDPDPVSILRDIVSERSDESAQLLRNWLEETEEEEAAA